MKKLILFLFLFLSFIEVVKASYVVMDQDSLKVLSGSNIHEEKSIASISKIMTAYLVIKNCNLSDLVEVGPEINSSHGSSIYLKEGEIISVRDLLYGLILRSGNDAAITLAKYTSGSVEKFVSLMNIEARKLNMKNTIFENPTGLDDEETKNISSAYDMALLTSSAMKNKVFKKIFKTKKHTVKTNLNTHSWVNKNKTLFMDKYITGGKTGYTKKARRTLVTTSSKNNINTVIVTLNEPNDFKFHVLSHKNIYLNYDKYLILNKNNLSIKDSYYKKKFNCSFYLKHNYSFLAKRKELKETKIVYELYKKKYVKNNDVVGKVKVYFKDKEIYEDLVYIYIR